VSGLEGVSGVLEKVKVNALEILSAAAIIVVGVLFAYFVRALMRRSLAPRMPPHAYKPLENLVFYSLLATAGVLALYPLGLNLSSLIVAGGLTGIVVGFAAQSALGNLISGLFLLVEQPLRVGDPVSVAGVSGVVANISFLSTTIRTWDGTLVRIPNNTVFNEQVVNYYRTRARRVEFTIGIHYDSSIEKAVEAIRRLMEDHPYCLVNPQPEVFVEEYADSSINLRVRCWAPPQVWFATKVDLITRLKSVLDEAGVAIPYPQLDLHIASAESPVRVRLEGEGGRAA
jgi:small-conductance mechanosensitive channel